MHTPVKTTFRSHHRFRSTQQRNYYTITKTSRQQKNPTITGPHQSAHNTRKLANSTQKVIDDQPSTIKVITRKSTYTDTIGATGHILSIQLDDNILSSRDLPPSCSPFSSPFRPFYSVYDCR